MWIVATDQSEVPAGSSPACAVPDGTAHAYDPETGQTACGLSDVTAWPELAWPPAGMAAVDVCPACVGDPGGI